MPFIDLFAWIVFVILAAVLVVGRVKTLLQAIASGQTQVGGLAVAPTELQDAPFVARIKLDDQDLARRQHGARGDLYRSCAGEPHDPESDAAADRDSTLRQPILSEATEKAERVTEVIVLSA
jgi:hypothetical protein